MMKRYGKGKGGYGINSNIRIDEARLCLVIANGPWDFRRLDVYAVAGIRQNESLSTVNVDITGMYRNVNWLVCVSSPAVHTVTGCLW
jgi:hypothetical protein